DPARGQQPPPAGAPPQPPAAAAPPPAPQDGVPPQPPAAVAPPAPEAPVPPRAGAAQQGDVQATPVRLSFIDGDVSFWRPGADDWAPAQINTPLAPGDALYGGDRGSMELQVGSRAFARASAGTQLRLANNEPDFMQLEVLAGHLSLDVRNLKARQTV